MLEKACSRLKKAKIRFETRIFQFISLFKAMHLYWKDRTSGKVEDDVYLFPDDAEFVHVPQCKDGRVYLLKFKSHRFLIPR
jgi:hypothetical protein